MTKLLPPPRSTTWKSLYMPATVSIVQLSGDHHHPWPNACDSQVFTLSAARRAGTDLRGDGASLIRNIGAALERHIVGRRADSDFQALGEGRRRGTKTDASDGYVPLHPVLAGHLRAWQRQTTYAKTADFLFPSMRVEGRKPLCSSVFVADHLRPAAKKAGVQIEDGQRFGLHNLRHSLSNWLVNKAKVEPKTVQGILRHSKIQTTLDLYTQEDSDETRAAQGEFLSAVGMSNAVN